MKTRFVFRYTSTLCLSVSTLSFALAQSPFPLPTPLRPTTFPLSIPQRPQLNGYALILRSDVVGASIDGRVQGSAVSTHEGAAISSNGMAYAPYGSSKILPDFSDAVSISAGGTMGINAQGHLILSRYATYWNGFENASISDQIPAAAREDVIACEFDSRGDILVLYSNGELRNWSSQSIYAWEYEPVPQEARSDVVAFSYAHPHRLALKADGSVIAWGTVALSSSMMGTSSWAQASSILPAEAQTDVVAIAAGKSFGLALKNNGSLVQWGNAVFEYEDSLELPAVPRSLMESSIVAISCGRDRVVLGALTANGDLTEWGIDGRKHYTNTYSGNALISFSYGFGGSVLTSISIDPDAAIPYAVGAPLDVLARLVAEKILSHTNNYGLATKPDLLDAVQQAADEGETRGIMAVQSAPNTYDLYSSTQYQANYNTGILAGTSLVTSNPSDYNLYTSESIMDLRMEGLMIPKTGGVASVTFQPQTTTNLATKPFTNNGAPITFDIPMSANHSFMRVEAKPFSTPVPPQP